jgi:hypothetical protein
MNLDPRAINRGTIIDLIRKAPDSDRLARIKRIKAYIASATKQPCDWLHKFLFNGDPGVIAKVARKLKSGHFDSDPPSGIPLDK